MTLETTFFFLLISYLVSRAQNLDIWTSRTCLPTPNKEQDTDVGFYKAMELTKLEFLDRVNYYG